MVYFHSVLGVEYLLELGYFLFIQHGAPRIACFSERVESQNMSNNRGGVLFSRRVELGSQIRCWF